MQGTLAMAISHKYPFASYISTKTKLMNVTVAGRKTIGSHNLMLFRLALTNTEDAKIVIICNLHNTYPTFKPFLVA